MITCITTSAEGLVTLSTERGEITLGNSAVLTAQEVAELQRRGVPVPEGVTLLQPKMVEVARPVMQTVAVEEVSYSVVDGKAVRTVTVTEKQEPVWDEYPIVDEAGNAVMNGDAPAMYRKQRMETVLVPEGM